MSDVIVALQTALEAVHYLKSDYKKIKDIDIEIQLDGVSRKLTGIESAFAELNAELATTKRHISEMTCNSFAEMNVGFIASTPVQTASGAISIENIRPGDVILTPGHQGSELKSTKVVDIVTSEAKPIWVIKFRTFDEYKPQECQEPLIYNLYASEFHPFWVDGVGWTALRYLKSGYRLALANGSHATVECVWPVIRTPVTGVGWVSTDTMGAYDGLERAHIVDFRNGCNLWHYHWRMKEHCGITYCGTSHWGHVDGLFESEDFSKIFYSENPNLCAKTFNLKLEDSCSYFVGELGILAHNTIGGNGRA